MADRDPGSVDPRRNAGLSRRTFLVWTGQAALGIAPLPILAACGPSGGNGAGSSRPATSTVIVSNVAALKGQRTGRAEE